MTMTLSRPTKKLSLVSVRHVYRCREYPRWRIEKLHITPGETSNDAYADCWQVWRLPVEQHWNTNLDPPRWLSAWELVSEHRSKAAALKAMGKAIRREER